jgi:RNA methyltransferase, TrmH family
MPPVRRRPLPPEHLPTSRPSRAPLHQDGALFAFQTVITSPHNDKLKEIRRLTGPARRRGGRVRGDADAGAIGRGAAAAGPARFVAEGEDLLATAAAAGWPAVYELRAGVDVEPELLDAVSGLGSGTRALGVFEQRWAAPVGPLCVALWGVRDPGNVGTVVRSALAFGAASVALGPDCADPFGPKAVRASMGAIFAVPVARVAGVGQLPEPRIALVAHDGGPLHGPLTATLIVGAERDGLPDELIEACDAVAHIPIAGDSLNAAMAATVGLYEASRVPDR